MRHKTIPECCPLSDDFPTGNVVPESRAFAALETAAGRPATDILKRGIGETVASNFTVRPTGCTPHHVSLRATGAWGGVGWGGVGGDGAG